MQHPSSPPPRAALTLRRVFYDKRSRAIVYQALALGLVGGVGYYLFANAAANLQSQNIASGFGYLGRQAGFEISDTLIPYGPSDSYLRALMVGLLNTVYVSVIAAVLCTILGTFVGILRLSPNPLLARLMLLYVEFLRNIPLLLHLFLWYSLIVFVLPPVREAMNPLPGVFLSSGGFYVPSLDWLPAHTTISLVLLAGGVTALLLRGRAVRARVRTGKAHRVWPLLWAVFLGPAVLTALILQPTMDWSIPELGRFRFAGGARITAEFAALLLGLTLTASATVAEIVRSGIQSIDRGQWEAARALGLKRDRIMRLVILPQAMRVIVPPMTSTYVNVTKNSTLAIAIGYPDLVMVSNTTMNQTGQAIEAIALFMAAYLGLSLMTSMLMNWYNARVALKGR